jgi:hypothetical protein
MCTTIQNTDYSECMKNMSYLLYIIHFQPCFSLEFIFYLMMQVAQIMYHKMVELLVNSELKIWKGTVISNSSTSKSFHSTT